MTIVVTGGGSGGHITPILAVAHELKQLNPDVRIVYVGQTGDGLGDLPSRSQAIDDVRSVSAGKLRRYHGEGLKQLLDVKSVALNIRDVFRVLRGFFQSIMLLRRTSPDVIFIKGGFVGVPVGLAAALLKIPFVTHDSDALPGLANRIIARWARKHAVAMPKEVYRYPVAKTVTVGVPIVAEYKPVDAAAQAAFRTELGIPLDARMLFVIGGGLGAQRVNQAVVAMSQGLLEQFPDLYIAHGVGRANEAAMQEAYAAALNSDDIKRVSVHGFLHDVYRYSGAADVVITRAGATNLAEFAAQAKACIIIPNPLLTGGHQLKNAAYLQEKQAAEFVNENDLQDGRSLLNVTSELLSDADRRQALGNQFKTFAHPYAARELASLLLEEAKK